jgi:flagellar hook-associated protein 2
MGTIVSSGVGSGLDVQGLVQKLVAAEGQPQTVRLSTQEAKIQSKISALGSLRSALSNFKGALDTLTSDKSLRSRTVSLSNPDFITATATTEAAAGIYEVEVERLATSQQLTSDPVAGVDTAIGTGTLTISMGAEVFSVTLDAETGTLAGIRDAINGASDNPGVQATIITGVDGARLLLTGSKTGIENVLTVTQTGDAGLEVLSYDPGNAITNLTELRAAQDARVLIAGFAAESSTNTISDAVSGLAFSLLAENQPGETTLVSVALDRVGAAKTVKGLVDGYNGLMNTIASVASYNSETKSAGPLLGDAGLRNIGFQLRREFNSLIQDSGIPFQTLSEIGVSTELDGTLSLDTTKLDAALSTNAEGVRALFADSESGLATRLTTLLEPYLSSDGLLDNRNDGLKAGLDDIKARRDVLNEHLAALEQRLTRQFNALDTLLAQLQSTSNYLQQQLNSLPGFTSN